MQTMASGASGRATQRMGCQGQGKSQRWQNTARAQKTPAAATEAVKAPARELDAATTRGAVEL